MRYSIYDACFSESMQTGRGLSALYLVWELHRHGLTEYSIEQSDIILATVQSPTSADFIRLLSQRHSNKIIVCGGSASTSPYSIGLHCDVVCVGDGQNFLSVLFGGGGLEAAKRLPNAWIDGETRRVEIDQGFPWNMPPIQSEDKAYRLWCGHGCKNKCKFCQTGWAYKYSENPSPKTLIEQAEGLISHGKRIAYLSNDLAQHKFYSSLPPTQHGSYSVAFLKKVGLPPARQIRLGIEGVSERLRKSVSKPISYSDLLDSTIWLNNNHKSVRWFMISGLPTEIQDDWNELKQIIQEWKLKTTKGVLAVSFTAFLPEPATPFATLPINDDYWPLYLDFKDWFFGGQGWSNRVKLMFPASPESRMKMAMLKMGLTELQLREGGHISPNARLIYPYENKIKKLSNHPAYPI